MNDYGPAIYILMGAVLGWWARSIFVRIYVVHRLRRTERQYMRAASDGRGEG